MKKRILISRTDSIGDVVLTLPLAGAIKRLQPETEVYFLGRTYTIPVLSACTFIDKVLNWDDFSTEFVEKSVENRVNLWEKMGINSIIHVFPRYEIARLAWQAQIPERIGVSRRWYHWLYCNRRISLSRRNSPLHEAQLNLALIDEWTSGKQYSQAEISTLYGLNRVGTLPEYLQQRLSPTKFNLILHPKSKGSAREWSLAHYTRLIKLLPVEEFNILITGARAESEELRPWLDSLGERVQDLTGKMTLDELVAFIYYADGLVAASTGPLHLAAGMGKFALGLYPPIKPMHPGRWSPIGTHAEFLCVQKECVDCRNNHHCACMDAITPEDVATTVRRWKKPMIIG